MHNSDYRICKCGGILRRTLVKHFTDCGGRYIEVGGMEGYHCDRCGTTLYADEDIRLIERLAAIGRGEEDPYPNAFRKGNEYYDSHGKPAYRILSFISSGSHDRYHPIPERDEDAKRSWYQAMAAADNRSPYDDESDEDEGAPVPYTPIPDLNDGDTYQAERLEAVCRAAEMGEFDTDPLPEEEPPTLSEEDG